MRTFIAVDFPADMLNHIAEITTFFKGKSPPNAIKWVETANLHLTLKFLGEINEETVDQVRLVLNDALSGQKCFTLEVSGLGMYPHKNNPRVIWFGIVGGEPLIHIHRLLDSNLKIFGITADSRPFTPHLTIARVKQFTDQQTSKSIGKTFSEYQIQTLGAAKIDRVNLYQSKLTPTGPIYSIIHSVELNQV